VELQKALMYKGSEASPGTVFEGQPHELIFSAFDKKTGEQNRKINNIKRKEVKALQHKVKYSNLNFTKKIIYNHFHKEKRSKYRPKYDGIGDIKIYKV